MLSATMYMIEPVQAKHIEGIHRAFDAVCREGLYFATSEALPIVPFADWMNANLRLNSPQFVAVSLGSVVGWSIAHRTDEAFARHCCTLFMGLDPRWRGRGIGRQLLLQTINNAWRLGLNRIGLDVYAHNLPAIQLYRQVGFVDEGIKRRAHCLDGQYRDVMNMALLAPIEESHAALTKAG